MRDTIYRESAIDALSQYPFEKVVNCISIIEELPSAQSDNGYSDGFADGYRRGLTDAQPERPRGERIKNTGWHSCKQEWMSYKCSECGKGLPNRLDQPNYCPNCGADMMDKEGAQDD